MMQSLPIFAFAFLFGIKFLENNKAVFDVPVSYKTSLWMTAILAAQLMTIVFGYSSSKNKEMTSGLTTGPINILIFFGNIVLVYILVYLVLNSDKSEKIFFRSLIMTFVVFFVVILLPQIIATFSTKLDSYINFIGHLFETHHKGRESFYSSGSYTTTMRRVNGFEPEASYLAALIGIVFVPPILASLKNDFNLFTGKKSQKLIGTWFTLGMVVLSLFFAKTSTGFLVIALLGLCLFKVVSKESRRFLWTIYLVLGCILVLAYLIVPSIHTILNQYVLAKQGTDNRVGGTIAAFKTFLHYPFFGVGMGYTSDFYIKFVPHSTINNFEYQNVYLKTGYPSLTVLGGALASYGLFGVVPLFMFIRNKVKAANQFKRTLLAAETERATFLKMIIDSFYFYILFSVVLSVFVFSWQDEIYVLMLMIYLQIIRRAQKEYLAEDNKLVKG